MSKIWGDGISWENFAKEILEETGRNKDKIFFKYGENKDRDKIIDHIKKYVKGGRVLDIGCNISRWSKLLKESGLDYIGIDQSREVIRIAIQYNSGDLFYCQFLWDITFDNEFDLIFCNNVLQHNTLEEKCKILPRIYDALKNKGILFLNESTVYKETMTQLTYSGWINLVQEYGFKFLESWQPNKEGINECYLFRKE